MSTLAEWLLAADEEKLAEVSVPQAGFIEENACWDPERFASEQLRHLVRQVFMSGDDGAKRQVVFSAIDARTRIDNLCLQVGQRLTEEASGTVCLLNLNRPEFGLDKSFGRKNGEPLRCPERGGSLRKSSRQISSQLWEIPEDVFRGENENALSPSWLCSRLEQLRLEFDYAVLCGAACGVSDDAAVAGRLTDGVVLVLEANSTRRLAAESAKATLQALHTQILGVVLSERRFPIPERIYRKF